MQSALAVKSTNSNVLNAKSPSILRLNLFDESNILSVQLESLTIGKCRVQLESKDAMRKRGMPSPDEGDAIALCFSEPGGSPVVRDSNFNRRIEYAHRCLVRLWRGIKSESPASGVSKWERAARVPQGAVTVRASSDC
jgi:hypothetical protein